MARLNGHPLGLAIEQGHIDAVRMLIEHGADLTIRDKMGDSYLHYAARYGRNDIISLLIESGMDINTEGVHFNALNDAILGEYYRPNTINMDTVRLLIGYGIDINNSNGHPPLYDALCSGYVPLIELLMNNGADITMPYKHSHTPIHRAAMTDNPEMIDLMIKYGADININTLPDGTPLTASVRYSCNRSIRHLIGLGADPSNTQTHTDKYIGKPLSEMAKDTHMPDDIVELIRDYEAKWAS